MLAKGLSRKRVNNILACLSKMLPYAHEIEILDVAPRVKLLKIPPQRFLTFDELPPLLDAVKDDPERMALVLLSSEAGLRQGEMIALEWGDLDLVTGTMTVHTHRGEEYKSARSKAAANAKSRSQRACAPP